MEVTPKGVPYLDVLLKMKTFILSIFLILPLHALTKDEVIEISKLKHDASAVLPELAIFTQSRRFSVSVSFIHPEGIANPESTIAKDKIVKGGYNVSEFSVGKNEEKIDILMVLTYSSKLKAYRKWVLNKTTSDMRIFTGIRVPNTSTISWIRTYTSIKNDPDVIMAETHNLQSTEWIESYYKDGQLLYSMQGKAVPIK